MNPRKNRPVLFELASRTSRARNWPVGVSLPGRSSKPAAAPAAVPGQRGEPAGAGHRWIRVTGGRVLLDLGWPHMAAAGVLLMVLLVATFQAGARSARPAVTSSDELQSVLSGRPQAPADEPEPETQRPTPRPGGSTAVATPLLPREEPPAASEPPSAQTERPQTPAFEFQPGCAYVVVQHLSKRPVGVQAADKIREFLASKGIPVVIRPGGGDLEVIATEPFRVRQADAAAAKRERDRAMKFIEQIRKLGQEFNPTGGYSFDKCYLREPQ